MKLWRGLGTRIVLCSIVCGLLGLLVASALLEDGELVSLFSGGVAVVMALAAALGFIVVVGPLTRRIDRLRTAAGQVGSVSAYQSAGDEKLDELGELSAILDDAHARITADARKLEERQAALERSLADVVHDLRTPIASLQIALEHASTQSDAASRNEILRGALTEVVYLGGLTANLRLACRLRDGWSPAEQDALVDLSELAERVAARLAYFAKNRRMTLEVARPDGAVFARCHPIAAEQALTNLVENSISHGEAEGHVAVVLGAESDRFSFAVSDDGPGVLPAQLPKLGGRTFRSDEARQRDPGGLGLGLAITSEVCAHCGWSLAFEVVTPRGLRVSIKGERLDSEKVGPQLLAVESRVT